MSDYVFILWFFKVSFQSFFKDVNTHSISRESGTRVFKWRYEERGLTNKSTNTPLKTFQNQCLYWWKFEKPVTILTQNTMPKSCFLWKTGKIKTLKCLLFYSYQKTQKLDFRNAKSLITNKHYIEYVLTATYGITEFQEQRTMS